jgi:hypothetical protein
MTFADDEKEAEVIIAQDAAGGEEAEVIVAQDADDEKMTEEMAKKIKELDVITIENKGYKKDRKGPAKFEHVKHAREYKISCWECHHEYKEDQQNEQPVAMVEKKVEEIETVETAPEVEDIVEPDDSALTAGSEQSEENVKDEKSLPKELTAQNIWSPWGITKKCSECHDPQEKKNDVIKLQAAYHLNCKTCHIDRRIYGNKILEYRKCTTCHE